jgi:signal transduction histidine kinase
VPEEIKKNGESPLSAPGKPVSSVGHYEKLKAAEYAKMGLLQRPHYSFRMQLYMTFLMVFLFAAATGVTLILVSHEVEKKQRVLEIVNEYMLEIQQARRFEKNFFLYGTNLSDALDNVYRAKATYAEDAAGIRKILGSQSHGRMMQNLERYETLLKVLSELEGSRSDATAYQKKVKEIEIELREQGQKLVAYGEELMKKEKASLSDTLLWSRRIHVYALIFLMVLLLVNGYFLGKRILGTINRFSTYARRIAGGDFTPITPAKRFRDEFTDLAIAINQMMLQLESREAVLVQSHKMRAVGTLTAGVAHELNNPLNNITLTAHMLLEDYEKLSDDERKDMIKDIVGEAGRSKAIIVNLLDFARESTSHVEPLDLEKILRETITLASNQLKLAGIKIELHSSGYLQRVHGDSQQLRQVFLNLILNAIDASKKGDKIQLLVTPADEPGFVAVKVVDSGTGIPEHILGNIFDPFFTTKPKGKGTGLGLSVSQGIITKHGGRIMVTSKEGQGTTFTVILPVTTIPADIGKGSSAL